MTTTSTITKTIETLKARMAEAQSLAARFAELQAAAEFVSTHGPAELAALEEQLAEAQAVERTRADAVARFRIVSIRPNAGSGEPVRANTPHSVEFIEKCADSDGRPTERMGKLALHGLTPEVWGALMADPRKLPPVIRSLDADPAEATRRHIRAVQRGHC